MRERDAGQIEAEPNLGPIVILLERRQDEWLARWSGADAWFVKPVDPFELADRLVRLIGERRTGPAVRSGDTRESA